MCCTNYPGIKTIGYLFADQLPADTILYSASTRMPISLFLRPTLVPIVGNAVCEVETKAENNGYAEELTLTFQTVVHLPKHRPMAFVIEDVNGNAYLIGQLEKPHLAIHCKRTTSTPDGDAAVFQYEVKQTAPICLKSCKMVV